MGAPPWGGPFVPALTPQQMMRRAMEREKRRNRSGANWLVGATMLHFIAIPITLILLKALVAVGWGELLNALSPTGTVVLLGGILAQVTFALVAGLGAFFLFRQQGGTAIAMVVVGTIAVIFSFAVFGGIFGALGGMLSIGGGATAWPRPRPVGYPTPPPLAWPPQGPFRP